MAKGLKHLPRPRPPPRKTWRRCYGTLRQFPIARKSGTGSSLSTTPPPRGHLKAPRRVRKPAGGRAG
eukprot:1260274-Pyramimonas_sp.AAC.1